MAVYSLENAFKPGSYSSWEYTSYDTLQTAPNGQQYNCTLELYTNGTGNLSDNIGIPYLTRSNYGAIAIDISPYFASISCIGWTGHLKWSYYGSTGYFCWQHNSSVTTTHGFAFTNTTANATNQIKNMSSSTGWVTYSMSGATNSTYTGVGHSNYTKIANSSIRDNYSPNSYKYFVIGAKNLSGGGQNKVWAFALYGMAPNTAPEPPIIVWPASIASPTTYNHQPWFKAQCGVDADNDDQTIEYKIGDTGTYTAMNTEGLKQTQTIEKQHTTTLSNGAYTIYMRSYDGRAYSSEVSRTFYVATAVHDPTDLAVGEKIELRNLTKLKDQITTQRKYYGITNDFLTTKNIGDKITAGGGSLDELRTALSACKCPTISTMPGIGAKAAFANSINVLLTSLSNA